MNFSRNSAQIYVIYLMLSDCIRCIVALCILKEQSDYTGKSYFFEAFSRFLLYLFGFGHILSPEI